jgi:hypothetical protein
MLDALQSTPVLVTLALAAIGLAMIGALGTLLTMRQQRTRYEMEGRLADLARRVRSIEARVEGFESRIDPLARKYEQGKSTGLAVPTAWRKESQGSSAPSSAGKGEPRTSPTLIAIPDLAVPEEVREHQAQSELGQRHGQVWALADAGVPPEEIARQTRQPIGQVELILGLYRQVHSSGGPASHAPSH